jgi:hypothetical protein
MKMLYFAMVHSHIVYCLNVYSCANITTLNPLKIKQKEAVRVISNSGYCDHTGPFFKRLAILPLGELIKYSQLKFKHIFYHKNYQYLSMKCGFLTELVTPQLHYVTLTIFMFQHSILPQPKDFLYSQCLKSGMKQLI